MLQFTDLNNYFHIIPKQHISHVQARIVDEIKCLTFHLIGPNTIAVSLDIQTADRILTELGKTLDLQKLENEVA